MCYTLLDSDKKASEIWQSPLYFFTINTALIFEFSKSTLKLYGLLAENVLWSHLQLQ